MKPTHVLPALGLALLLAGCGNPASDPTTPTAERSAPDPAQADAFIAQVNEDIRAHAPEDSAAAWLAQTYINSDSELIASKASERAMTRRKAYIDESMRFVDVDGLADDTARALDILRRDIATPLPRDPASITRLAELASRLNAAYGAGKYCSDPDDVDSCRNLDQLSKTMSDNRNWDDVLQAWQGWHTVGAGLRGDYQAFVQLLNEGARDMGYADTGALWRSGYDMPADALRSETDRLWSQVEPLYRDLHCHVRHVLQEHYPGQMPDDGTIPAHITGNMWAQDWSALYPWLEPYPGASDLDVDAALQKQGYDAPRMVRSAENFYRSLGLPALPGSFYEKSQLVRPRDRDVVCHASAWDMNMAGDVRIKMCIQPTEEELRTIYHELGHIYYDLAYNPLPPLFQNGAHDGFHEAVGDTVQLSLTPQYLSKVGLADAAQVDERAMLNAQMKLALEKVVFLPFGKLIDEWRWDVFDGSLDSAQYNAGWWQLRRKYQGISPPLPRSETDFDPGAKYHVPDNTPYLRYFLAHILQFQFQRALCAEAGNDGPLHACSIFDSKAAGDKLWRMLQAGASQPWQKTLQQMTGQDEMDASAIIDYFAPLQTWLKDQNSGRECGWSG